MHFQGLNKRVELEGNGFFYMYTVELAEYYLNSVEANVHDHRKVISKDSAIRQTSGRKQCLKASCLSFGDDIFHLKLLHGTADGFLSNYIWVESELVALLLEALQNCRKGQA